MVMRRSNISLKREPALIARRVILKDEKLVYVLIADKKVDYKKGRSKVVYIGTTKKGGARIAQSVAWRSKDIFAMHGVKEFSARTISCRPRRHVKMWRKLERAMLLAFKEIYEDIPSCNIHGVNYSERDEFQYFSKARVKRIIEDLS